ncbi:hypothetical protein PAPYR_5023 [Paratrimastix pyriformis]|uniref:F-box domain-containing protein n=1 Tax=Paratrimastix pyriformis TaxID=342808 RepID=A0ABQ8UJJ4_9EUKA|nr:hypothetical protein PAPYR_5023 [Paratrimastix pyriformis]
MAELAYLPDELFIMVLANLNGADLGHALQTCKRCSTLLVNEEFWRNWCRNWLGINRLDGRASTFREAAQAGVEFTWDPDHSKPNLIFSDRNRVVATPKTEGDNSVVLGRTVFRPGDCRFWEIHILGRSRGPTFTFGVARANYTKYAQYLNGPTNSKVPSDAARSLQVYLDLHVRNEEYIALFIDGVLDVVHQLREFGAREEWATVGLRPAISMWYNDNILELSGGIRSIPEAMLDQITSRRAAGGQTASRGKGSWTH